MAYFLLEQYSNMISRPTILIISGLLLLAPLTYAGLAYFQSDSSLITAILTVILCMALVVFWAVFCIWFYLHTPMKLQDTIKLRGLARERVFDKLSLYLNHRPARVRGTLPSMLQNRWLKLTSIDRKKGIIKAEVRNLGHYIGIIITLDEKKAAEQLTLRWTGDFAHNPSKAVMSFLAEQISSTVLTDWIAGPATFLPARSRAQAISAISYFTQMHASSPNSNWTIVSSKKGQHSVEIRIETQDIEPEQILIKVDLEEQAAGAGIDLLISWMPQSEMSNARIVVDDFIMQLVRSVTSRQHMVGEDDYLEPAGSVLWPTPQDFNEAIQSPDINLSDEELQNSSVHVNALGLPLVQSGAFASVYRISSDTQSWAVRCFLTPLRDQEFRYYHLSNFIENDDLPYTVGFNYQAKGLRSQNAWYPILKMDWVEGETLDNYINKHIEDKQKILALSERFEKMMSELQEAGIAHGDLQHANILVRNDELVLVDYDCMYIPALEGMESNELGHRNYQHPQRNSSHFGPYLDDFAAQVIGTSLKCISIDPSLWSRLRGGDDCLLFRRPDFEDAENSRAFQLLLAHENGEIRHAASHLKDLLQHAPDNLPISSGVRITLEPAGELVPNKQLI